jgi:hypothetical protein
MVLPVGEWIQELIRIIKTPEGIHTEERIPVRFVPMVHEKKGFERFE